MSTRRRGFRLETVFCETCGESAEGIPDTLTADGLPEGWRSVVVSLYRYGIHEEEPTSDRHERTYYYCSEAHLPAELLPGEAESE